MCNLFNFGIVLTRIEIVFLFAENIALLIEKEDYRFLYIGINLIMIACLVLEIIGLQYKNFGLLIFGVVYLGITLILGTVLLILCEIAAFLPFELDEADETETPSIYGIPVSMEM